MKTVTLLYDPLGRDPAALRALLVEDLAAGLAADQQGLTAYVTDEHAAFRGPSPFPLFGPRPVGLIDAWGPPLPLDALIAAGFVAHQWESDESIPTEYGDNAHALARDWPDGERSPGPVLVSLLERPRRLDEAEWLRRWHGVMSPVSAEIQPRTRYIRNRLLAARTPDPPRWDGLVVEAWPSRAHIQSPWLFYGASSALELIRNQLRILAAVQHCFNVWRIHTAVMSEYILASSSVTVRHRAKDPPD